MKPIRVYGAFERLVAYLLLVGMAGVVALAAWSFLRSTGLAIVDYRAPLEYTAFQTLFDRVLAAIIAIELGHSIYQMALGDHRLAQVRTVIVIGVLAVVRKLITLEVDETSGIFLIGIAAAIVALGIILVMVHWLDRGGLGAPLSRKQPEAGKANAERSVDWDESQT